MSAANNSKTASKQDSAKNKAPPSAPTETALDKLTRDSLLLSVSFDPKGMAAHTTLSPVARRMHETSRGLANGLAYLQVQNGALRVLGAALERIEALCALALDPGKRPDEVAGFNKEFGVLNKKIADLSRGTYNGHEVFGAVEHALEEVRLSEIAAKAASIDLAKVRLVANARNLEAVDKVALDEAIADVSVWRSANEESQARIAGVVAILGANRQYSEERDRMLRDLESAEGAVRFSVRDVLAHSSEEIVSTEKQDSRRVLQLIEG